MSRSSWKLTYLHNDVVNQYHFSEEIFVYNRASVLTKGFIGKRIHVYNGIRFYSLLITSEMLGHRLGEFAPTRKKPVPKKDKKKIKKKK